MVFKRHQNIPPRCPFIWHLFIYLLLKIYALSRYLSTSVFYIRLTSGKFQLASRPWEPHSRKTKQRLNRSSRTGPLPQLFLPGCTCSPYFHKAVSVTLPFSQWGRRAKEAGRGSPSTGLESYPHRSTADEPVPHRVRRLERSLGPEYRSTCVDRMTMGLAHKLLVMQKKLGNNISCSVTPM